MYITVFTNIFKNHMYFTNVYIFNINNYVNTMTTL